MEKGAATVENSTAPMVAPEVAVDGDQHAKGLTVSTVVPKEAADVDQHTEGSTVPMVVLEEAGDTDQRTKDSAVQKEAVDAVQHAEGLTVPMVVPEEAVNADQHVEGLTVPMVAPEEANADQHVEGSTMPMAVTEEEATNADQHVASSTVPMVVPEEDADAGQQGEGVTAPMELPEAAVDFDHHIEDVITQDKHRDTDGNINVTPQEMRGIIEVIADTGKFWHEWSFLKRLLSLQLMQVLGEYSEAQMVVQGDGQRQNPLSAETHSELFSQLNDALLRFEEGPPFTLQRLCEILLDPKGTYTKLSKLALALEKTLLVTSTITKCTDPYPAAHGPNPEGTAITENTDPVDVEPERLPEHPAEVPNGTKHPGGDGDEEMADAECEAVPGSHDVDMQEEKLDQIAEVNPDTNSCAAVASEVVSASEQSPDPQS